MAISLSLEGIASVGGNEDRALVHLYVDYDGNTYNWQVYVPIGTADLSNFLINIAPAVQREIDTKEAEWDALDPKTREIIDPITGQTIVVPILKEEIVKPDIPDYYAQRRNAFPSVGEQLDAIWSGEGSDNYNTIINEIDTVKDTFDKKYLSSEELQAYKIKKYTAKIQKNLDNFARQKKPFLNMSDACTYVNTTTVNLYKNRALYCIDARASMWKAYYDILKDVEDNVRSLPTTFANLELELPTLTWP